MPAAPLTVWTVFRAGATEPGQNPYELVSVVASASEKIVVIPSGMGKAFDYRTRLPRAEVRTSAREAVAHELARLERRRDRLIADLAEAVDGIYFVKKLADTLTEEVI